MSLYSSSLGSCEWTPFNFLTWKFLDCPFFSFSMSGFSNICDLDVLSFGFLSVSPNHINPFGWVSFNNVNLPKPVHESVSSFFLCYIQIGVSWPDDINVFQWNREWLFLRARIIETLLSTWWRQIKSPWIDQKSSWISVSSFVWDSPLRFPLLMVCSRLRVSSLNSKSLPDNFAESQEIQNLHLCGLLGLLLVQFFWDNFCDASNISNSSISATRMFPFEIPPAINA